MNKDIREQLRLYLVIETSLLKIPLKDFIVECFNGGVTAFQLRDKELDANRTLENAFIIKETISSFKEKPLFIINDRVDIALIVGACGVHLGVKDISPKYVKQHFPNLIIGTSCNNLEDTKIANQYADYAGIGPAFYTSTKKDLRQVIGVEGISNVVKNLNIGSVAIGGINIDNVNSVLKSGVNGVALSSYICSSDRPYDTVKALLKKYE